MEKRQNLLLSSMVSSKGLYVYTLQLCSPEKSDQTTNTEDLHLEKNSSSSDTFILNWGLSSEENI